MNANLICIAVLYLLHQIMKNTAWYSSVMALTAQYRDFQATFKWQQLIHKYENVGEAAVVQRSKEVFWIV